MKRILYITYVDYLQGAFPGVEAKIAGQMSAMAAADFEPHRIHQYGRDAQLLTPDGALQLFSGKTRRFAIVNAVRSALSLYSYTAAYIRFQFFSEDVRQIAAMLQKAGTKVLMEFPTYPYEGELHQQGLRGIPKLICDRLFRYPCAKYIDAFVTQAEEPKIYGVPCIRVLNGLDFGKHPLREISQPERDTVRMAAVASMLPWHGYDRLIEGLAAYYQDPENQADFQLHLVGDGKELARYRQLVREHNLTDHVVFHGMQGGDALRSILSGCDIAIGSLGAHRIGLKKLSTLKSREYCAWGLPSVNATPVDMLSPEDPFCLFVPEGEAPVDMKQVLAFHRRVYFERGMTPAQIAALIRSQAEQISDVHNVFLPVIHFIQRGA